VTKLNSQIAEAIDILRQSRHAVALTGAGISTPSGIPDFRSRGSGLWEKHDPVEVASITAFKQRPENFYRWLRPFLNTIITAKPNPAHHALTQLEAHGPLKAIITQNIDTLHKRAGSQNVLEVHGHLREATCLRCYDIYQTESILEDFFAADAVPQCPSCGGVLKPNVILFGELLPVSVLNKAKQQVRSCDVMLAIGSSLEVAPVGDLPLLAKQAGAYLIFINLIETHLDPLAEVVIHADVADILPQLAAPFLPKAKMRR
jgi:NAD-dependent deacetylase